MTAVACFGWGLFGSLAIEVVLAHQALTHSGSQLPSRYRNPLFWAVRACLAVVGGGLAVAYGVDSALLAVNVGAATPLLMQSLARSVPTPPEPLQIVPARIASERPADLKQEIAER